MHRPTLDKHVQQLGPSQWARTGQALLEHNKVFGQTFTMMSKFLKVYETQRDSWFSAAINGHSLGKMFPLTEIERQELDRLNVYSMLQLFEVQDNLQTSAQTIQSLLTLSGHITQIYMTSSAGSVETSGTPGCHCGQPIPLPLQQLKHISNKITSSAASIGRRLGKS
jgi:hypothetical protein